jgi:hypothetical protein
MENGSIKNNLYRIHLDLLKRIRFKVKNRKVLDKLINLLTSFL